jgi:hypothetical protein
MNPRPVERRTGKPVLLKLTETDRELLKIAAKRRGMPMTTFAYQCVKQYLDAEFCKGGAS